MNIYVLMDNLIHPTYIGWYIALWDISGMIYIQICNLFANKNGGLSPNLRGIELGLYADMEPTLWYLILSEDEVHLQNGNLHWENHPSPAVTSWEWQFPWNSTFYGVWLPDSFNRQCFFCSCDTCRFEAFDPKITHSADGIHISIWFHMIPGFWYPIYSIYSITLWWTNIAMENGHRNSGFSH